MLSYEPIRVILVGVSLESGSRCNVRIEGGTLPKYNEKSASIDKQRFGVYIALTRRWVDEYGAKRDGQIRLHNVGLKHKLMQILRRTRPGS